jgi:hypothetical protein
MAQAPVYATSAPLWLTLRMIRWRLPLALVSATPRRVARTFSVLPHAVMFCQKQQMGALYRSINCFLILVDAKMEVPYLGVFGRGVADKAH